MYHSKLPLNKKPLPTLKKYFLSFLKEHQKIYCSALGRPVFLNKQPNAILMRKDAKNRLECFSVAIDILKHAKQFKQRENGQNHEFSIIGLSKEKTHVTIHLREELDKKDRRLFLISVFYK